MSPRKAPLAKCDRVSCPVKRGRHDDYAAFRAGCRSDAAWADKRRYSKLTAAGLHPHARLPVGPYARRLRCLAAMGWGIRDVAAASDELNPTVVDHVRGAVHQSYVEQGTARAVDVVFRQRWDQEGPSPRARQHAARVGWPPAAAFDDIDDMTEQPQLVDSPVAIRSENDPTPDEIGVQVRCMARSGRSVDYIARELRISTRTVERHRAALTVEEDAA